MSKPSEIKAVAQEVVKVIPHVMRAIGAERPCSGYAIPPAHFRLLGILASHSCNLSELAVRRAVSLPTMSNSISVLVERGWVKRTPSPHDRRQVLLELTPDGRAVLADMKNRAEARVAELLGELSPDELADLVAGLAILERAFAPTTYHKPPLLAQDKIKCVGRER
jgi:DNA-binding MarR family transcriptional regulator